MENALSMTSTRANTDGWGTARPRYRAALILAPATLAEAESFDGPVAGFDLQAVLLDPGLPVPADFRRGCHAIVVETRCDQPSSMERLHKLLADADGTPVLAAIRGPTIADVRRLMQDGVVDILPLPLKLTELGPALERISSRFAERGAPAGSTGRIVSAIKSRGGVGATAILTQAAAFAAAQGGSGKEAGLIDLDVQCGNAGLYLGQLPALNLKDLLDAGERLDASLLRATMTHHTSGLHYLAAPHEILPTDFMTAEQVDAIVGLAAREFEMLFVDLPHDWTDWSLSILARSDTILLVCDLSVASLHQAKRKLDLLRQQDIGAGSVAVVMNKVTKGLFKSVNVQDAARILGRPVAHAIAEDNESVGAALNQGELVSAMTPRSRFARDLRQLTAALAASRIAAA
jgi:pilus assembly protein CpaE